MGKSRVITLIDISAFRQWSGGVCAISSCRTFRPKLLKKSFLAGNFSRSAPVKQSREGESNRKEVMKMKSIKFLLTAVSLTGTLGAAAVSTRAETVISKDVLADGSYCHMKFESIRENTLASGQPILKDVDDIIDFYGPCNHDPLGKEELKSQKIEMQHRFENDYND
jgi:hypothetical protein